MNLKVCTLCGQLKPLDQFSATRNRVRRSAWCKPCAAAQARARRAARSQEQRERDRVTKAIHNHSPSQRECIRNWKVAHPDKLLLQRRRRNSLLYFGGSEIKKLIPESLPALVEARISYLDLAREVNTRIHKGA